MNVAANKPNPWILVVVAVLTLVAGGGWGKYYFETQDAITEYNKTLITNYLSPIQTLLNDNKSVHEELYNSYLILGWGILESYVEKVKIDGFESHALMKARIRTLDKNNDEIILLIKQYSGHILVDEFSEQSKKFRNHAIAWSDRLDAIAEVIKTGKQFPVAEPFPKNFPEALRKEIEARKGRV